MIYESPKPLPRDGAAEITERAYDHPDAVCLVRALFDEQIGRYGFADPAEADPASYAPPHGLFLVVYIAGIPRACCGYRTYDPATATIELRKLYTAPEVRGRGIGRLLLSRLEHHAARQGARRAILETGARNLEALALIRHAGYQPTARYVRGRDPAINRAFCKALTVLDPPPDLDVLRAISQ